MKPINATYCLAWIVLSSCSSVAPPKSFQGTATIPKGAFTGPPVEEILRQPIGTFSAAGAPHSDSSGDGTFADWSDAGLQAAGLKAFTSDGDGDGLSDWTELVGGTEYNEEQVAAQKTPMSYFIHRFRQSGYLALHQGRKVNLLGDDYFIFRGIFPRFREVRGQLRFHQDSNQYLYEFESYQKGVLPASKFRRVDMLRPEIEELIKILEL